MIASSKKIVTWKFGYPDDKKVHDVTLKHSVTGGKKVILENQKEIVKIGHQAVVTDFAHGWESDGHVMRVAVSTKNEYSFSVDGVEYEDFPTEAGSTAIAHELAAKKKEHHHDHHPKPKRLSSGKKNDQAPLERRNSASFDPFASGGSTGPAATGTSSFYEEPQAFSSGFDSTDPFASPTKTETTDPFTAGFDAHITTNTSQEKQENPRPGITRQFTSPREEFETHSPPPTSTNTGFNSADLFADNSPPPQQKQQQQQQQSTSFDFFTDQSASNQSHSQHHVPNMKPPPPCADHHKPHHHPPPQVNDFFADNTPPPPPQQQPPQSTSAYDFSGMTYNMPTMDHNPFNQAIHESFTSPHQEQQQQQQTQKQPPQVTVNDSKNSESLFGLVNLDLSSGNPPNKSPPHKSIYGSAGVNTNQSAVNTSSAPASSSVNPFDSFATNSGPPVNHVQSQYQQPTANTNWMASGNIGMMTDQSSFMNSNHQQQSQYGSGGKPQQGGGGKTSLDSLDWKM